MIVIIAMVDILFYSTSLPCSSVPGKMWKHFPLQLPISGEEKSWAVKDVSPCNTEGKSLLKLQQTSHGSRATQNKLTTVCSNIESSWPKTMINSTRNWEERVDDSYVFIQSMRMHRDEQGSITMLHTSKATSFPESFLKGRRERSLGTSVLQNKTKNNIKVFGQFQLKFASCLNYTEKNRCFASA